MRASYAQLSKRHDVSMFMTTHTQYLVPDVSKSCVLHIILLLISDLNGIWLRFMVFISTFSFTKILFRAKIPQKCENCSVIHKMVEILKSRADG